MKGNGDTADGDEIIPGASFPVRDTPFFEKLEKKMVRPGFRGLPVCPHFPDREMIKDVEEPVQMVVMRVGEDDHVQGPYLSGEQERGHDVAAHVEPVVVKTAPVDEHDGLPGKFNERSRSLAHVDGGEPQGFPFRRGGEKLDKEKDEGDREASGGEEPERRFWLLRPRPPREKNPRQKKPVIQNEDPGAGGRHDGGREGKG